MTPQDDASATLAARALPWRTWLVAFAGFVIAIAAVLWMARGPPRHPDVQVLGALLLYMSIACTFLPLPTAWIVLWAARESGPLAVALVATLGTCIANLHDYYIVSGLCRLGRVRQARQSGLHARAVAWFHRAPFAALAAASFVPIPIDGVRLLAISAGYPRRAYLLATFAGRFPRYVLLALLGHELKLSNGAIAGVLAAMAALALSKAALDVRRKGRLRAGRSEHAEQ